MPYDRLPLMFAAVVLAGTAGAATPIAVHGPKDSAVEILAAEHAFAEEADKQGSAAAFRDFMDPVDGREFAAGGDPISGPAIFAAHKEDHGKLAWTPSEVFAAKGRDMGLTWGRWTYTPLTAAAKPLTGRYVTAWRKDAKGRWKAIIDIGNPDP